MNTDISKILRYFITYAKLSNYLFFPTGSNLSTVTLPEYMRDEELRGLFSSYGLKQYLSTLEIYSAASPSDVLGFLKTFEGRAIVKRILDLSSFKHTGQDPTALVEDAMEQLPNFIR